MSPLIKGLLIAFSLIIAIGLFLSLPSKDGALITDKPAEKIDLQSTKPNPMTSTGTYQEEKRAPIPREGQPNFKEIETTWHEVSKKQGFRPQEFLFDQGVIVSETAQGAATGKRKLVWLHRTGKCQLIVDIDPSFQPTKQVVICKP